MKLLKIGNTTINVNRVLRFDDDGAAISVSFLAPDSPEYPVNARFEGEQAEALRVWITKQAKDIMKAVNSDKPTNPPGVQLHMETVQAQLDQARQDNQDV